MSLPADWRNMTDFSSQPSIAHIPTFSEKPLSRPGAMPTAQLAVTATADKAMVVVAINAKIT